jgi:hypothetical protein
MVAAPRASLNETLGLYVWDSFYSLVGCYPLNVDDVSFLNGLLDKLIAEYPVDPQRVYIYGYLLGRLWLTAWRVKMLNDSRESWQVPGIHSVNQNYVNHPYLSVLQFHSISDEVVLFNRGNIGDITGNAPGNPACEFPSAIELLTRWADLNGCVGELKYGNKPKYDLTTPGFVNPPGIAGGVEGKDTTVNKFQQCPPGIDVELWSMEEGIPHPPLFFHFGPNGIKTLAQKSWEFLRSHKR